MHSAFCDHSGIKLDSSNRKGKCMNTWKLTLKQPKGQRRNHQRRDKVLRDVTTYKTHEMHGGAEGRFIATNVCI